MNLEQTIIKNNHKLNKYTAKLQTNPSSQLYLSKYMFYLQNGASLEKKLKRGLNKELRKERRKERRRERREKEREESNRYNNYNRYNGYNSYNS